MIRNYISFIAGYGGMVIAAGLLLFVVLFLSSDFIEANGGESAWSAKVIRQKTASLAASQRPRIAIAGGSNAVFGLDAAQMSDSLKLPVVNLAVHASLVWRYLDFYALSALERGDTLVLPLEIEYFVVRAPLNTFTVESAHALGLGFFFSLPLRLKLDYLRLLSPGFLANQIYRRYGRVKEQRPWRYWLLAIGPHGDVDIGSVQPDPDKVHKNALRGGIHIDPDSAGTICAAIGNLRSRGIRVIATPPNIFIEEAVVPQYEMAMAEIASLARRCGGEFMAVPLNGRQPLERMWDTRYHLIASGRRERTAEFVRAFREADGSAQSDRALGWPSTKSAN